MIERRQCWRKADIKTRKLMLKIAGVENRNEILLTKWDIQKFSCNNLKIINTLWLKASKNHFDFSIIHHIYHEVEYHYFRLAKVVGWKKEDHWIKIEDINLTNNAPKGHLPLTWLISTTFNIY
ncbi:GUN4 domain-containing protein [Geminocystis sp. GBBB08]|uniref:GUN4 domain-containing protein n=1 Tax=Geminocystis sp. GBBB08 TaxID=2604140 RepID=UPI0027E2376E|nr:GUN4 domain-containing protein [Geminocystis sp. GBBB08]MBL1209010.1 GUN4 domain-containing protein [Geminocystis sp. GBBB08]